MSEKGTVQDIFDDMQSLVDTGDVYLFESIEDEDDEDYFKPYKGKPLSVTSNLYVEVVEGNGILQKGAIVMIDPNEYCFMRTTKV